MSDAPTPHELARDLGQLEGRLEREYDQLRGSIDRGFARINDRFDQLQVVHPEHFHADQQRQDQAIRSLQQTVADELRTMRRQVVGGFLGVIALGVVAQVAGLA